MSPGDRDEARARRRARSPIVIVTRPRRACRTGPRPPGSPASPTGAPASRLSTPPARGRLGTARRQARRRPNSPARSQVPYHPGPDQPGPRRGGRVVEGARLESGYTVKSRIEGSNPSLSARTRPCCARGRVAGCSESRTPRGFLLWGPDRPHRHPPPNPASNPVSPRNLPTSWPRYRGRRRSLRREIHAL